MTEIIEEELRASIFAGDAQSTFALLEPHPTAELKRFQKMLAKIRTEQQQMERTDWKAARVLGGKLVIAGVLCSDTPAQAAGWLTRRRLFDFYIDKMPDPRRVRPRLDPGRRGRAVGGGATRRAVHADGLAPQAAAAARVHRGRLRDGQHRSRIHRVPRV
jgi:hypothetical protein